jgi:5-methyltetrahydropteroyltriglutamate--homocysteine methyltransferase
LRYFDNNFFYRIPVFVDRPDIQKYYITRRVKFMREINPDDRIKIVIPGPVTFAYLSKTDLDRKELVFDILRLYQLDLSRAQEYKLDVLQLDEPILLDVDATLEHCDLVEQYVRELKKTVQCKVGVALYFGVPRDDIIRKVVQLPVDFVCLNVCEHAGRYLEIFRKVKDSITTKLVLGIVDGRNIRPEEFEEVKKLVEDVVNIVGKDCILGFTTSSWLDLIPLKYAIEKTMLLGRYGLRLAELLG